MKKIFYLLFLVTAVFFAAVPAAACAEDLSQEEWEISQQMDDILAEYDINYSFGDMSGLSFGEIMTNVKETIAERITAPLRMLGTLLVVAVFTAVMRSTGDGMFPKSSSSGLYDMICVMTAAAVITPQLLSVYSGAIDAIDRSGGFLLIFVPVFAGITIASGGVTSGALYNMITLAASELIAGLSRSYLMPVLSLTAVLAVSGSVFPKASLNGLIELIKKLLTWGMTVVMTLFTGFVALKCTVAGKADGVATKAVKFVISGFIPIVGNAVSDAYSTVRSSFGVIRSTVGMAGAFAIVLIMLPPVLEILIYRAVMWIGTAAAEILSAEPLVRLMKGIDSGLAIAQSVLICYSMMFVLCTAILMQTLA